MRPLLIIALLLGCGVEVRSTFASPCEHATHLVAECGATIPLLAGRACTGLARMTATCITEHASDCDTLASLTGRLEVCLPDAGDDFFPTAEELELPVGHRDAGVSP